MYMTNQIKSCVIQRHRSFVVAPGNKGYQEVKTHFSRISVNVAI